MVLRRTLVGLSVAVGALYGPLVRRGVLTWGATENEAASRLPGDELLERADSVATRAIDIDAPAAAVWPWLAQMGPSPRGGAYTYDWIENLLGLNMHSVDRVLDEFQHPKIGDTISLGSNLMQLQRVEPQRLLAWRSEDGNWVWTFILIEHDLRTRLISRNRFRLRTRAARIGMLPMEPGSLAMERKMLRGIKQRAERLASQHASPPDSGSTPVPGRNVAGGTAAVDLYWLPLGAGGRFVRLNGRIYEALVARMERRPALDLYHSALEVQVPEGTFVVEQAPVPRGRKQRGVVVEGAVGNRWAGQFRIFRYEIRRWRNGYIPDVAEAIDSPRRLSSDEEQARRVLRLVDDVPTPVWGRDDLETGDMWNSNSVIAWVIARSGIDMKSTRPPAGGRAPGWEAGLVVARRRDEEVRRTDLRSRVRTALRF
jgi:hypothetical protein